MLGLNLNNPHRKLPKEPKKGRKEILVPALAIDKCRLMTSRNQWCAEASATLHLRLPNGISLEGYKFVPDQKRKSVPIEEDVYEEFVRVVPESERQVFLDCLFEWEGERILDAMCSRYEWHMADVYGRDKDLAARTRKRLEDFLGVDAVEKLFAERRRRTKEIMAQIAKH